MCIKIINLKFKHCKWKNRIATAEDEVNWKMEPQNFLKRQKLRDSVPSFM